MLAFFQGLIFTNIGKINNLGNASFNDFVEQIIIVTKKYSIIERQQDCCYFLTDIIDLNQDIAIKAFKEMVLNRKNPNMDEFEVLESLRKVELFHTANYFHALL